MTIHDRKKKRRRASRRKLSSSAKTELLKTPTDVLELGRHLVRELNLEDEFETLGRWMAHHVAELISETTNGTSKAGRLRARKLAVETILKIWDHRESLPGYAYPLARYDDLMKILDRIRPEDNPFRFSQISESKTDQYAGILFDRLTRLVIALLLIKLGGFEKIAKINRAVLKALDDDEKQVLTAFLQWNELFAPKSKAPRRIRNSEKSTASREVNLNEVALQLIDVITTNLGDLRQLLVESPNTSSRTRDSF